jgi:nitric oxide synthase oxygenase domain/subunit
MPALHHPVFRATEAFLHDTRRPAIDPDRAAADWALMYEFLRRDPELAGVCGFGVADLSSTAQERRIRQLRRQIGPRGRTFTVLPHEMQFWVRYAWISADRCSGRQHALQHAVIRHRPEAVTATELLEAAVDHAVVAMSAALAPQNTITVLGPPTAPGELGPMFATEQLVRFAGRRRPDGSWSGDGGYLDLTSWVARIDERLISPSPGHPDGSFDTLPMVAVGRPGDIAIGTCPPHARHLVEIPWPQHPEEEPADPPVAGAREPFATWSAVPLQTNFALDIAGQRYCVLFSGWYVDEEIAANLLDPRRYDWLERVSLAIHGEEGRERMRHADRLDEYRVAQVEIATLRAVRTGFKLARCKVNRLGPSQSGFGKFFERHLRLHGRPPANDTGWTANRFGSRYRHASHAMPHVAPSGGSAFAKHWLTVKSMWPDTELDVVDLSEVGLTPAS